MSSETINTNPPPGEGPSPNLSSKSGGSLMSGNNSVNFSKSLKLLALGTISFAIPVIYFFQANELKKKELKNSIDLKSKDSLEVRLEAYYDTSLQYAKVKAYKTYADDLTRLINTSSNQSPNNEFSDQQAKKLDEILLRIQNISSDMASLKRDQITRADIPKVLLTQQEFENSMKTLGGDIAQLSRELASIRNKSYDTPSNDTSYFLAGQIEQYRKRLSDLYILFNNSKEGNTVAASRSRRRIFIENELVIEKTRMTLDSLILDLNNIYQRFPKF